MAGKNWFQQILGLFGLVTTETDQIGTIANTGGTPTIGAVLGDVANVDVATRLTAIKAQADKTSAIFFQYTAWSAKENMLPSLAFSNVAAALASFPNVVVPAGFLPTGYVIDDVYLLLKWRKMVNSNAAPNAISAAAKTVRIKLSTGDWATPADNMVAMTMANGAWNVAGSASEGGDVIVGTVDLKSIILSDNVIVNVASEETNSFEGIVVTAASITLYDVEAALVYKIHV